MAGIIGFGLRAANRVRERLSGYDPATAEDWENPQVFEKKRQPMHTPLSFYPTRDAALSSDPSPYSYSLDGTWRFYSAPNPYKVPEKFQEASYDDSQWVDIPVPSNVELEGHGVPIYTNITYPFPKEPPRVPHDNNLTSLYRRTVEVPPTLLSPGRRVHVIFHGADSCLSVWANGKWVGYSQDSRLPAEFDITDIARESKGRVCLAVRVIRWCDGSYLEDQDHWWLSGLHRSVEIMSLPPTCITDYKVTTAPTSHSLTLPWKLQVALDITSHVEAPKGNFNVKVELFKDKGAWRGGQGGKGDAILTDRDTLDTGESINAHDTTTANTTIGANVNNPSLWSAEEPNLYTLLLTLTDAEGNILQVERCHVGFRHIEIKGSYFLINQQPVKIKGVNRHEHHETRGKVQTEEDMVTDLKLLKQNNLNAIRLSHYPNNIRFYELCDEYGFYLVDEANIECHGMHPTVSSLSCDSVWEGAYMARVCRMVQRDKNFPCIVIWSLGNESGYGPNLVLCRDWIKQYDPTRPVQYEGGTRDGKPTFVAVGDGRSPVTDIVCPMYPPVSLLREIVLDPEETRPIIACEYAHAMGNSNGNLSDYFEAFYRSARLQGGFIWDWVDQGILTTDKKTGKKFWAYGGDFGPSSGVEDKNFCINGLVFPDRTPHPSLAECRYLMQPLAITLMWEEFKNDGTVPINIHNRNYFVVFKNHKVEWEQIDDQDGVVASGVLEFPSIAPQYDARVMLPLNKLHRPTRHFIGQWLRVRVSTTESALWAPAGHVVCEECFSIAGMFDDLAVANSIGASVDTMQALHVDQTPTLVEVRNSTTRISFDLKRGALSSFKIGTIELLSSPIEYCFWRAPTDNDRGGIENFVAILSYMNDNTKNSFVSQWRKAGMDKLTYTNTHSEVKRPGPQVCLVSLKGQVGLVTGGVKATPAMSVSTTFAIYGNGEVVMESSVTVIPRGPLAGLRTLPRVGITTTLPRRYNHLTYLGRGPTESYPDRQAGSFPGVYTSTVEDQFIPYIKPSENGGHASCQWVSLTDEGGLGLLVETCNAKQIDLVEDFANRTPPYVEGPPLQVNASIYSPADLEAANHPHELPDDPTAPIHLHIDHRHMGLGGDTSWMPMTMEKYLVPPQAGTPFEFSLRLRPVLPGQKPASLAAGVV